MSLIQPLKFITWEMGHFKMPRFETLHLQTAVFQTVITVASGLSIVKVYLMTKHSLIFQHFLGICKISNGFYIVEFEIP